MKTIIKYGITGLMVAMTAIGCSDWLRPERVITQHPDEQSPIIKDNAYYEALREYKKTKHKIAFGWYGSWTATGASRQSKVSSAPDSMDIISIWSQWHSLTPEQMADKEFVQKVKGTKVTYTIFLHDLPTEFQCEGWPDVSEELQNECIERFAKSYCKDSMDKYQYDGIDIDYEPGFGGSGALTGNPAPELFNRTVTAMAKYVGPKSGTGRLFMIDGVPGAVRGEYSELFDYGIVQAYSSGGYTDLQHRFNEAYNVGWKPEQYIFAENFESHWKNGGVSHTTREGERVNSLLGMARFNPEQGFGAGFGAYHMEYEYAHADMPYKWMRRAIQDVNPAGGLMTVSFKSAALEKATILIEDDGSMTGSVAVPVGLNFARPLPEDVSFSISIDNSLVEEYNKENKTEYLTVDPSKVTSAPIRGTAGQITSEDIVVGLDHNGMSKGQYLIPVRIELPEDGIYTAQNESLVKYILVTINAINIDFNATEVTGTKISPAAGWTINCYMWTADSGATGVWNCDSDQQKAAMFDGAFDANCWYANNASWSWGSGGNFKVTLDKEYEISGFRWHIYYDDCNPSIEDVLVSSDGKKWSSLLSGNSFVPKYNDSLWKIFQFKEAVKARYIRVMVGPLSAFTSMNEIEFYAPAN